MKATRILCYLILIFCVPAILVHSSPRPSKGFPVDKEYKVVMPLTKWATYVNALEYTKQQLKKSDLPARDVNLIIDSVISPLQTDISTQINEQVKADTVKPKKQ